jgi:hypothetical protein
MFEKETEPEPQTDAEKEAAAERDNFEWRFMQYWNTQVDPIGGVGDRRQWLFSQHPDQRTLLFGRR